ncbi:TolC family protein [Dinghuibacter silviterrae]|uniref:Outer membrane protein n=1 Tax=Dinghuibacter silviterrae TaxID=1539049 RepID=A0A4R8DPR0_9BACT|nr:TolC family protein [Dinghuibacter silviterrae]TDX00084.1 outer membrane protein [Dinghuibacter silviterrae]
MRKLTLVLLFGTSVTAPGLVRAQEKWGLRKCVEYAMANNISVRQADIDARISELTFKQSRAAQYGQWSFNTGLGLSFGYSVDPTTNQFIATDFLYQSYTLQGGVNLFNWFSQRRLIESNKLSYLAAKTNIDKVRNDVSLNVSAAYLTALAARQQVDISIAQVQLSRDQLTNTQKLVDAGSQPELNAAELEAQLASDSAALISAQATYDQDVLQLKATLSLDAAYPFVLDTPAVETIPVEPIGELQPDLVYAMAERTFPQSQLNEYRIQAADKAYASAKGQLYPTIQVFGSLGDRFSNTFKQLSTAKLAGIDTTAYFVYNNGVVNNVLSPNYTYGYTKNSFGQLWQGYWNQLDQNFGQQVGIQLNVPIFNGNQARTAVKKAKLNIRSAELQKESDLLTLKQNVYQAFSAAVAAMERFQANRKALTTAQTSFDLASKRYSIGLLNTIDYITNQNNLFKAKINLLGSQYDYVFKMKVLEFYKGQGVKF